ncbi:MAG TPA: RNA methyltransferase [Anaerolineales bacterium]|nr:RNA methyltransferase [Anaerolineales bacterium]
MEKPLITSTSNPLVKQVRALRQRKARTESGLFIVEGIHHVGEAVEAGWQIESILYAPDVLTSDFGRDLIARVPSAGQAVSEQVIESLADKENPQGILALVHQRQLKLDDIKSLRCGAAVVSPQDAGNIGTILRTLDAVGADALFLLDGGVDPFHPTSVRASMGAIFWKPIVQTSFDEFVKWAHQGNYQLIGTSAHAQSDYRSFIPKPPFILLLGSEQKGLSPKQAQACDVTVSLPMYGRASSLNLAVAAGILLYQFVNPKNPS